MDSVVFKKSCSSERETHNVADQIVALMACCFRTQVAQQHFNQLWCWKKNRDNFYPPDDAEILWSDRKGITFLESRDLDELYELGCFGFCFISQIVPPLKSHGSQFAGEFRMSLAKEALGLNPQIPGATGFGKSNFYCEFRNGAGAITDPEETARMLVEQYSDFFTEVSRIIGGTLEFARLRGDEGD